MTMHTSYPCELCNVERETIAYQCTTYNTHWHQRMCSVCAKYMGYEGRMLDRCPHRLEEKDWAMLRLQR